MFNFSRFDKSLDMRAVTTETHASATPPADVLAALIDSLYAPIFSFVVGSTSAVLIAAFVAARTGLPFLRSCAMLLTAVFVWRLALIWRYLRRDRSKSLDLRSLQRWELGYALGAYAFAASLGALGAVVLFDTDDAASHMLVYALAMGFMAGAATRNSGLRQICIWQIVLTLAPIIIAAAMRGDFAYDVLAFVTLLYCLAGVEICLYQSSNQLRVLLATREKSKLAQRFEAQNLRFDAALNNMPQGLCMFDAEGRLIVSNKQVGEIFGAERLSLTVGSRIPQIAEELRDAGALSPPNADEIAAGLQDNLAARRAACSTVALPDGRTVSYSQTPLEDGGSVALFDDVTERHRAEKRVRYLATHDMLTGLPNRTLFNQLLREEIDASKRHDRQFCVLFIDLDRFKSINDTLGHAAGDALLREASRRLGLCLRERDIAARLGGDEFVAIVRDVHSPQEATAIAENVLVRLNDSMNIAGQECGVTASIGVAAYPADGEDEDTLLKNADAAMYLAKAEGKSGVRLFSPKIKTQTLQGLMLETSLRHALARDEFLICYQPKRDILTGAITGVEALLRWRHPKLGLLSPHRFIPVAEETGLISPIGKWVLETACAQQMQWRAQGLEPFPVAVNLSPRQLYDEHLLDHITGALEASGMGAEWLELEITESMVMLDAEGAMTALHAIKEMGARLAIDDFGTGYSSLSLVKQMPLDAIKIDRSFINDLLTDANDRAIAEAVISLAKALKLRAIAEGVETEAQETFLREHGCHEMQGFLISRPLEGEALLSFVADYNMRRLRRLAEREREKAVMKRA